MGWFEWASWQAFIEHLALVDSKVHQSALAARHLVLVVRTLGVGLALDGEAVLAVLLLNSDRC